MKVGNLVFLHGHEEMGIGVVLKFYSGGKQTVRVTFTKYLDHPIELRQERLRVIDKNFFQENT